MAATLPHTLASGIIGKRTFLSCLWPPFKSYCSTKFYSGRLSFLASQQNLLYAFWRTFSVRKAHLLLHMEFSFCNIALISGRIKQGCLQPQVKGYFKEIHLRPKWRHLSRGGQYRCNQVLNDRSIRFHVLSHLFGDN